MRWGQDSTCRVSGDKDSSSNGEMWGSNKEKYKEGLISPQVRGKEAQGRKSSGKTTNSLGNFQRRQKYAQDRRGAGHWRVSNTLQTSFFPAWMSACARLPGAPVPSVPTAPSHPAWVSVCHPVKAPSAPRPPARHGRGSRVSAGEGRRVGAGRPREHRILPPVELASSS